MTIKRANVCGHSTSVDDVLIGPYRQGAHLCE